MKMTKAQITALEWAENDPDIPPNPGSDEAIEIGCTCPVIDNGHGRGYFGDGAKYGFVVREDCPLHGGGDFLPTEDTPP